MSKVKVIFNEIWVTFTIVLNSAYGILVSMFAFYALTNEAYNVEKYIPGVLISVFAMVALNGINFITRWYLRNY